MSKQLEKTYNPKEIEPKLYEKWLDKKYFHAEGDLNLTRIYDEVRQFEKERTAHLQEDIKVVYETSRNTFTDTADEDREFLQFLSFICTLCMDVCVKKQIIEKLIDLIPTDK